MADEHARLSASESHRWMNCTGSVEKAKNEPRLQNAAATQGTGAHALLKTCIDQNKKPEEWLDKEFEFMDGKTLTKLTVDQDMVDGVNVALRHVQTILEKHTDAILETEQKLSLEWIGRRDMFGTGDILIDVPFDVLYVSDFKFGFTPVWVVNPERTEFREDEGYVLVKPRLDMLFPATENDAYLHAEVNSQLLYYAAGALAREGWTHRHVVLSIVQPRCYEVPNVQSIVVPARFVRWWAENVLKSKADEVDNNPSLNAGSWCRWCPVLGKCDEVIRYNQEMAAMEFAEVDPQKPPVPEENAKIARLLNWFPLLEAWMKEVSARAYALLDRGEEVPGFKLVRKKTNRAWIDEEVALKSLMSLAKIEKLDVNFMTKPELLSPAQVEKLSKKFIDIVKTLAKKPESDLTVADSADPRDQVLKIPGEDFL